jgi:hypothetical protein
LFVVILLYFVMTTIMSSSASIYMYVHNMLIFLKYCMTFKISYWLYMYMYVNRNVWTKLIFTRYLLWPMCTKIEVYSQTSAFFPGTRVYPLLTLVVHVPAIYPGCVFWYLTRLYAQCRVCIDRLHSSNHIL